MSTFYWLGKQSLFKKMGPTYYNSRSQCFNFIIGEKCQSNGIIVIVRWKWCDAKHFLEVGRSSSSSLEAQCCSNGFLWFWVAVGLNWICWLREKLNIQSRKCWFGNFILIDANSQQQKAVRQQYWHRAKSLLNNSILLVHFSAIFTLEFTPVSFCGPKLLELFKKEEKQITDFFLIKSGKMKSSGLVVVLFKE